MEKAKAVADDYDGLTTVARSKFKPLSARPVASVALLGEGNAVKNRIVIFFFVFALRYCVDINPCLPYVRKATVHAVALSGTLTAICHGAVRQQKFIVATDDG
jgi:hypothetical protein